MRSKSVTWKRFCCDPVDSKVQSMSHLWWELFRGKALAGDWRKATEHETSSDLFSFVCSFYSVLSPMSWAVLHVCRCFFSAPSVVAVKNARDINTWAVRHGMTCQTDEKDSANDDNRQRFSAAGHSTHRFMSEQLWHDSTGAVSTRALWGSLALHMTSHNRLN